MSGFFDRLIGALFAVVVGVILYWLTGTVQNSPKVTATVTASNVYFPLSSFSLPTEKQIEGFQAALFELRERDPSLYDKLSSGILRVDSYRLVRLLANARCIFRLELKNNSGARAANINLLMPDIVAYTTSNDSNIVEFEGNRISIGELLPSETRIATVLTQFSCPSTYRRLNNEGISISYDGGSGEIDFFGEFGWFAKFVIRNEFTIAFFGFLVGSLLLVLGIFFVVDFATRRHQRAKTISTRPQNQLNKSRGRRKPAKTGQSD